MNEFNHAFDILVENVKRDLVEGKYFINEWGSYILSDECHVQPTSSGKLAITLYTEARSLAKELEKRQDLKEAEQKMEQARTLRAKWGL